MKAFLVYLLLEDGRVLRHEIVMANDDAGAMERARDFVSEHDVEIWEEGRKVGDLKRAA